MREHAVMPAHVEEAQRIVRELRSKAASLQDKSYIRSFTVLPERVENVIAHALAERDEDIKALVAGIHDSHRQENCPGHWYCWACKALDRPGVARVRKGGHE